MKIILCLLAKLAAADAPHDGPNKGSQEPKRRAESAGETLVVSCDPKTKGKLMRLPPAGKFALAETINLLEGFRLAKEGEKGAGCSPVEYSPFLKNIARYLPETKAAECDDELIVSSLPGKAIDGDPALNYIVRSGTAIATTCPLQKKTPKVVETTDGEVHTFGKARSGKIIECAKLRDVKITASKE